ncbi:MAG TPA: TIM barrel protein [Roseiflexaceae bacterium]|nr:TIM barrel protein [Roseiflexaceae bacterium]HMP38933.1 TIM barrel protein [Roseiflexaceae bacterium]
MHSIRLAAAPVSWGVTEVAEGAPRVPWQQVMDEIAAAGYLATELGPYGYYPTDAATLRTALDARGLILTSAFVPLPLADPAAFGPATEEAWQVARLLADLGAAYIVLSDAGDALRRAHAGQIAPDQVFGMDAAAWNRAARRVEEFARRLNDLGLQTVFHHHAGTYVETPAELRALCERTSAELVGICLDTGHYLYGGGEPRAALATYRDRVRYMHLKDVDAGRLEQARTEGWDFVTGVERGVFTALGAGAADIEGCLADLRALGYNGWAVVEQDIIGDHDAAGRTPFEGVSAARSFLRSLGL